MLVKAEDGYAESVLDVCSPGLRPFNEVPKSKFGPKKALILHASPKLM